MKKTILMTLAIVFIAFPAMASDGMVNVQSNFNVEETADRIGWSLSLVKVQTHRAKQKLKKLLENTDIEFEVSP